MVAISEGKEADEHEVHLAADAIIAAIESPLSTVLLKHLGDLCADADRWNASALLYARAEKLLAVIDPAWVGLRDSFRRPQAHAPHEQ